jgi:hypothetical protein
MPFRRLAMTIIAAVDLPTPHARGKVAGAVGNEQADGSKEHDEID